MSRPPRIPLRRALVALSTGSALLTGAALPAAAADPVPASEPVVVRRIVMPIEGTVSYSDDFGDPRSGGRTHEGNDIMASKGRRLLAAADARVRRVHLDDAQGGEGNMLVLRDDDGWEYWYIHINNDTPGTDDGLNPPEHAFAPGIEPGARVRAGQLVAYAGDSGNAENTGAHLHFEIHTPDRAPVNPYPSLRLAQGFRVGNHCGFDTNPPRRPDSQTPSGMWSLGPGGRVTAAGSAAFLGDTASLRLNHPVVGMAGTPAGAGYWLVAADGGIFAFGDATFTGSTGDLRLNQPIVGMAPTPSGKGYWLVAADGGIFAFGDAVFTGSTGNLRLNQPIVGMAPTPSGKGYWLVARDGGIFAFGDAVFTGSTGDLHLVQPIVGMSAASDGEGYWLVSADGGIFVFGSAAYHGSLPGTGLCQRPSAVAMVATGSGQGYWIVATDGSIHPYGDAVDLAPPAQGGIIAAAAVPVPPKPPTPPTPAPPAPAVRGRRSGR